jgi:hypothetical protein
MKLIENLTTRFEQSLQGQIAVLLIVSILFWAFGVPTFVHEAKAAYMTSISDTLSNSNNNSISKHTISFTTSTSTKATETIKIQLDPDTSAFYQYYSTATTTDITASGFTHVDDAAACDGSNSDQAYISAADYNNGSDENITFTVCTSDTIPAGPITITVGAVTMLWQNPNNTNSYAISIAGSSAASGSTRVAIIPNVTLTASVASTFTFTINAVPAGNTVGSDTTTDASTGTTIPFGQLSAGVPQVVAQRLNVTTNATNGFSVTVQENQPPTAGSGAIIYLFNNGATTTTPEAWAVPSGTLNANQTYGHLGITSTDSDLNSNEFNNATEYAGNIINPRVVFSHTGPSNGTTNDQGSTTVAFKVESTALLPAGDYTNTITYVATPTF